MPRSARRASHFTGAVLLAIGTVFYVACLNTSGSGDFFDSGLWWVGWIVLPGVSAAAGLTTAQNPVLGLWLVVPQVLAVVLEGTVFYEGGGPSFWPIGLMFIAVLGGACVGAWLLGSVLRALRRGA